MNNRVLIIEDDNGLASFISWQLERAGYDVRACTRASDGLAQLPDWNPGIVLLDVMMPDMDGWTACQKIREGSDVPVIFVTAMGTEQDVVHGLEMGADDYLIKPFGAKELVARINAVLRRNRPNGQPKHLYTNGRLSVNLDTREVTLDAVRVELTPIEFKLLACLIEEEGKVLSHRFLLGEVWGPDYEDRRQYLKLDIWYLRQKLEVDPIHPTLILTQRGIGYRLARAGEVESNNDIDAEPAPQRQPKSTGARIAAAA